MTKSGDLLARANRGIDATGDVRALAILRILLGPIVLLHLEDTFRNAADGIIYSDRFYLPYAQWYPEAGRALYLAMLWAAGVAAIAMSIGLLTRLATSYTAFFVGYNIFLSKTHFAHNRAFLLILLTTIAIIPVGRHYSIDSWLSRRFRPERRRPTPTPLWALWLVRFEVVAVYCSSATSKVIDQDWWDGLVLQRRAIDNRQIGLDGGAPSWLMDLLADDSFQWMFSKVAVLTEFVIALGFLHRRTRLFAIWIAIPFHVSIQIGARVQVFSWAALAALIIWVAPRARDRQLIVPHGHLLGRLVAPLDWFGRFEVVHDDVAHVALLDRVNGDGQVTTRRDADAVWTTLSRLPIVFWLAAPGLAVVRLRQRRSPG
jgi:hypothetical protein